MTSRWAVVSTDWRVLLQPLTINTDFLIPPLCRPGFLHSPRALPWHTQPFNHFLFLVCPITSWNYCIWVHNRFTWNMMLWNTFFPHAHHFGQQKDWNKWQKDVSLPVCLVIFADFKANKYKPAFQVDYSVQCHTFFVLCLYGLFMYAYCICLLRIHIMYVKFIIFFA